MSNVRQFWVAIIAALIFWILLFWSTNPKIELSWLTQHPLIFILPVIVYPVLEEIVFRGQIQEQLSKRYTSELGFLSTANILTSTLFSIFHLANHSLTWAVAVFIPSLIFGYFKDTSSGLLMPIILHVFYNAGYFIVWGV